MKKIILLALTISIFACKNKTATPVVDYTEETLDVTTSIYPENITKVFEAHGGLDKWNAMTTLAFTMEKPNGLEVTTTNLKNRKALIDTPDHVIGYNGEDVWLLNKSDKPYKGKPRFYYNLMFYFYAMPFILADDGINYEDAEPLVFDDVVYPGIKISYENGVGESSDDEYVLYYNPETYKMEWLGYTVTYFSKEKGSELHFRRYNKWQEVNGLLLPESIVGYNYENNKPTTAKGETKFINVKVDAEPLDDADFEAPAGAQIVD
ncbi:hypothetical protein FPF71_10275 [Algibacter amylolyticus]|uniref:Threonine synthase n=1 Tax=Algibacter amylolyticus TaxID=1608400 RepID=A0A5M7B7B3_9FLAO|nr:DUF6503 family protein [Algibacter amylolyticus]KAA5824550.1 hypothetical protein F2B50_10275 [Algibacter amylolyticus]MBB5269382.1 hypothetical protein [Algibacter amylolyticus]TSJ75323.1 hypothetical protein FPF71_10275 [Algibacter amylolyticus]